MKKILLILLLLIVACSNISEDKMCKTDSDCAPSQCCHASDSINKDYAPSCEGVFCSQECKPNTYDCGQGQIKCIKKQCQIVLN